MADTLAADRYASALFEVSRDGFDNRVFEEELVSFSTALRNTPRLEKFFTGPSPADEKRKLLAKVFSSQNKNRGAILDFFTLLLEKNRFSLVHDIALRFKRLADASQGEASAEIESAVPLDAASENLIVQALERKTHMKIAATKKVDPSLIGGIRIRIQNKVLDGTIKHKLDVFKNELTKTRSI